MYYRNSDLKVNRYFLKFKDDINEAKKHGREVFYNEVRKKNNCYYARRLQGDIYIKDIFKEYWPEFKEVYSKQLTRPGLVETIENFIGCHDFDNGFLFFECPTCNEFYMDAMILIMVFSFLNVLIVTSFTWLDFLVTQECAPHVVKSIEIKEHLK